MSTALALELATGVPLDVTFTAVFAAVADVFAEMAADLAEGTDCLGVVLLDVDAPMLTAVCIGTRRTFS